MSGKKNNIYTEPTWQDVIDFSDRVISDLEPLVEEDKHGLTALLFMNKALGLKHHAITEQAKEKEEQA